MTTLGLLMQEQSPDLRPVGWADLRPPGLSFTERPPVGSPFGPRPNGIGIWQFVVRRRYRRAGARAICVNKGCVLPLARIEVWLTRPLLAFPYHQPVANR